MLRKWHQLYASRELPWVGLRCIDHVVMMWLFLEWGESKSQKVALCTSTSGYKSSLLSSKYKV